MIKDNLKGVITLGALLAILGFILIFSSVHFGISLADNWLAKQGGADTSIYLIVIEGYTNNFLFAGSILFGVGLVTFIIAIYKLLHIKK
ncbi:hypothetical protein ACFOUV_00950 [Oceanobacillus longus]|uniref:DUF4321 domain-containing protein n=1 Tax=Oceanobacillus longus TaxID=930120 RepID=A0ABV8GRP5_9BACI